MSSTPEPNPSNPMLCRGLEGVICGWKIPNAPVAFALGLSRSVLCGAILALSPGGDLFAEAGGAGDVSPDALNAPTGSVENWQKATVFLFDEANQNFAIAAKSSQGEEFRANRLGEGATLLTIQPRTQGNIERAKAIFEELISGNPKDSAGLAARLHLARLFEFHASPQDPQKAREIYEGLLADGQGDPLAELAASRLVLIDLHSTDSHESLNAAAQKLAIHGTQLRTSIGRREFFSNMGLTLNQLRGDKKLAMEYLIAAEAEGLPMQQLDAPLLVTIAALAEELNDLETAKKYYSLFTSRYKRDTRSYYVMQKLEELGAPDAGRASPDSEPNSAAPAPPPQS
ncbi:MAG: hypothetical protein WEB60_00615 [Terrimicrobiaceae bacterium]